MHSKAGRRINVISRMPEALLKHQEPSSRYEYVYSMEPVAADWHVIVDATESMSIPNSPRRCVFVATEPPEIREYSLRALKSYGKVLSAPFVYLRNLRNVRRESGLLPWRVGFDLEGGGIRVNLNRSDLMHIPRPEHRRLSVVTSQKAITPMQIQRIKLIDYLSKRIPEMDVFGRGSDVVDDKCEVLLQSQFHLALENCRHPGFWTEKLSDPILIQNVTFYSGHNDWQSSFGSSPAIIEIDIFDPQSCYDVIRRNLDTLEYASLAGTMADNKEKILGQLNLHRAIERVVSSGTVDNCLPANGPFVVPRHRKSIGQALKRHSLRRRLLS